VKIAFIVQRYGTEILGGSEYHCRLVAERMATRHQVDVLTTCARDYITWENVYPEGTDRVRGVNVRRFPTTRTRDIESFNRLSDWIFNYPHTPEDEMRWLEEQGPWAPGLLDYLAANEKQYDVLIFFTYLYAPTVLGLRVNPRKSILVPTAHDEPAIHLGIYRDVFRAPAGIAYNTASEKAFLTRTFDITARAVEIVGCGVDLPELEGPGKPRRGVDAPLEGPLVPAEPGTDTADAAPSDEPRDEAGDANGAAGPRREGEGRGRRRGRGRGRGRRTSGEGGTQAPDDDAPRGVAFRRRHRLWGPLALYGGRIDPGKGCEELFEYFTTYAESGGDATLVLMGAKLMPIPERPYIRFAGMLSEVERMEALAAADVVIVPSPLESLSLLALEAMAVETPVLCNARAEVLVDHCRQSNAGLYYADRDEFVEALSLLFADRTLRRRMGRNGREYVKRNYRWDVILGKYDRLIAGLR
jgi:glycosyltransferase involved in cell wall biosynthesis